jgi:hypothetical protein
MAGGMKGIAKQLEGLAGEAKTAGLAGVQAGKKLTKQGIKQILLTHGYKLEQGKISQLSDEEWLGNLPENERTRVLLERQSLAHVQSLIGTGEGQGFQAPEWLKTQYQSQLNDLQSNMVNQLGPNAITSSAYADAKSKLDANYNQSMQQIALQELGAYDTLSANEQAGYQGGINWKTAPTVMQGENAYKAAGLGQEVYGNVGNIISGAGQARMGSAQISASENKGGGGWGSIIGSIAGTALGSIAGGAGGAIGSKLGAWAGGKLF